MSRLLVIDDDKSTRTLIIEIFEDSGIEVIECNDAREAKCFFETNFKVIDLVLLDIKLPDKNGWELCKELRTISQSIPIIAISAIPPNDLMLEYKANGFTTFLSKPFCIKELIELVNTLYPQNKHRL